jgi:ribosomal protein S18 acetylase RimI-like enzyme
MEKIRLEVYNDNLPAIGFYKKNGFEIEGGHTEKGFYMVKIL